MPTSPDDREHDRPEERRAAPSSFVQLFYDATVEGHASAESPNAGDMRP